MASQCINDNYRKLYTLLKSEDVVKNIGKNEDIINIIKSLPHPDVATYIDIVYVCKQCMMGSLERFYNVFDEETFFIIQRKYKLTILNPTNFTMTL